MNKKASIRDVVLASIMLFAIGISFVIIYFIADTTVDNLILNPEINASSQSVTSFKSIEKIQSRMDYIFLMMFVGLTLGIIITSWFVSGNPVYLFVFFIILIIGVVISAILANVWDDIGIKAPIFATARANLPITTHILNYLPYYVSILGVLSMITMFAKPYVMSRV